MKKLLLLLCAVIVSASAGASPVKIYRLNLDDEIGSTTWRYTRQALNEATAGNADIILVHLNTYGGSVVHADSIRTALLTIPGRWWPGLTTTPPRPAP